MGALLKFAAGVDWINERLGRIATWLVLLSCLVSAGNASIRYLIDNSSNAWLELQWYMFAYIVMLGASYTLKVNEHVRVDLVYGQLSGRGRAWVDLLGTIFFLLPATALFAYLAWPQFYDSFIHNELSSNAGGLIRWPAKLALPLGYFFLTLQALSEIIKRIGFLTGQFNMDTTYERPLQ